MCVGAFVYIGVKCVSKCVHIVKTNLSVCVCVCVCMCVRVCVCVCVGVCVCVLMHTVYAHLGVTKCALFVCACVSVRAVYQEQPTQEKIAPP